METGFSPRAIETETYHVNFHGLTYRTCAGSLRVRLGSVCAGGCSTGDTKLSNDNKTSAVTQIHTNAIACVPTLPLLIGDLVAYTVFHT